MDGAVTDEDYLQSFVTIGFEEELDVNSKLVSKFVGKSYSHPRRFDAFPVALRVVAVISRDRLIVKIYSQEEPRSVDIPLSTVFHFKYPATNTLVEAMTTLWPNLKVWVSIGNPPIECQVFFAQEGNRQSCA